ncbi:MAG: DUF47 family protein [Candidatus Omnitrophica bacterium]|nr:DUF47 family protein [Candidatus Omnitrophota bacterium]MBU4488411.1 DUF47 family protein [Candidatus Omnitrophota bacterium]MCG2704927.1 DUF47 family protein [Candidatus Omnitrophota bacterium]
MRGLGNILGWLGMEQERTILEDAQKHVEETYKTVSYFTDAIKAFIKGDAATKNTAIENVSRSEHEADVLRSKMVKQLSESLMLPPDREDLMHFVKSLDRIADWTNGAARILGFIETTPPESVSKNIFIATELILSSVTKLRESINALTRNDLKKALSDCEDVDRLEHEADDQKRVLIGSLIHAKLETVAFFLCYQLAEYLEGVTDKIEDAADFVKVVAIRSR